MRRAYVTGATGFIGRALCAELVANGWQVSTADMRQAGWDEALPGAQAVFHLAGVAHAKADSAVYQAVNVEATARLAQTALRAGVRRFVYVSSIKVNGEAAPLERPYRGSDSPAPLDEYGRSKWRAEQALRRVPGLEVAIVRPPLVYGPGVKANFLRLLRLVDTGLPLPFASIHNRRSFVAVGNLVSLLRRCAEHSRAAGATLVAADGEPLSTPELVRRMAAALGRRARLVPFPPALLPRRLSGSLAVDANEARDALDWQPPYGVDEGLARTAAWYRA